MDLEAAAQCEMAIHDYTRDVTSPQLWCGRAANIGLKRDVVYKIPGELETIVKNQHAATKMRSSTTSSRKPFPGVIPRSAKSALAISTSEVKRSFATPTSLSNLACPLASTEITGWRRASSRFDLSGASGRLLGHVGCLLRHVRCLLGNGD